MYASLTLKEASQMMLNTESIVVISCGGAKLANFSSYLFDRSIFQE
jgi:hypothetical protein